MRTRRALIAAAIVAAIALMYFLPVRQWSLGFAGWLRGAGAAGVALFVLVYLISAIAFVPGSLLTLAAGFAYGPIGGLLVASPASVLAATAAFLLGRFSIRGWVERKLADAPRARALDRAVNRQSFKLVLLLRLSPVFPYNVLNYALGLTDISLGRYVAASFLGMLPGTWLYVYLGSLATAAADLGASSRAHSAGTVTLWAIGLVATIAVVYFVTHAARTALQKELE